MKTSNYTAPMLALADLREKLGFNQELMAMYLNVNLSTIKMAEVGLRTLPTYALIKFAELEKKLADKNDLPEYNNIHPSEQSELGSFWYEFDSFVLKEKKYDVECLLLEQKLALMASTYQKTREKLQIIEDILEENKFKEFDPTNWKRQREVAINVLNKCGLPMQVMMKNKIEFLESQVKLCRKLRLQVRAALPEVFVEEENTTE